jgi:signal transduction histidine kinase
MLSDDLREQKSPQAAQADRMVEIIRTTNQTIRMLDRAMRLPEAAEGRLEAALISLVKEFQELTGIPCEVELKGLFSSLDPFRVLMLVRIVQEAMSNAVKHGNPRSIKVSSVIASGMLHTRVVDDGTGLAPQSNADPGSGLRIMKLRAELIGSQLSLRPNGNAGCIVECILPLAVERNITRDT